MRTRGICMLVSAIILTWSWSSSASWYISLRRLGTTRRTAPEPVLAPHTRPSSAVLFDALDTPGRGKIIRESSSARTQKHPKNGQQKEKLQPARGDATHNSMTFHISVFSAKCGGRGWIVALERCVSVGEEPIPNASQSHRSMLRPFRKANDGPLSTEFQSRRGIRAAHTTSPAAVAPRAAPAAWHGC